MSCIRGAPPQREQLAAFQRERGIARRADITAATVPTWNGRAPYQNRSRTLSAYGWRAREQ